MLVSPNTHKKTSHSEISSGFIFYDKELYFVSKCRQMTKFIVE